MTTKREGRFNRLLLTDEDGKLLRAMNISPPLVDDEREIRKTLRECDAAIERGTLMAQVENLRALLATRTSERDGLVKRIHTMNCVALAGVLVVILSVVALGCSGSGGRQDGAAVMAMAELPL